ncbi:MAG: hypothetical protein JSV62_14385 [Promethearchaeota archaeon]|nr:MAG: hypothetical protein JSV62_14385 [Candidatus Lokiarchaeota archaeon]
MILQGLEFYQVLADIIGAILIFLKPLIEPIGVFMVNWITVTIGFLQQNLGSNLTLFIVICVILIILGMIVNIIWPGDRPGTIFSKGIEKFEDLEDKIELSGKKDILDEVRRCKDCGNPIGDADVCSLCGARN